ncbi:hypothetical protein ACIPVK_06530 [Paeniglutamicibacter sp. MACA_103]|uniref:hypothetical protein n=1 Tax=Paeniglutamicibacter sp. MACA_103 TaxID=3377337 RepID=UPI0038965936
MLKWLGFSAEHAAGEVPLWAGVPLRRKLLSLVLWLAVAVAAYVLLNLRLPSDDGFGGFLPILVAILVFAAGSAVTERSLVRVQDSAPAR